MSKVINFEDYRALRSKHRPQKETTAKHDARRATQRKRYRLIYGALPEGERSSGEFAGWK
jgi:hypothetical protein